MALRFVFADDSYLVREGTAALLAGMPEFELVATAATEPELLRAVEDHMPDVVVTDIRMPPTFTTEGIKAARVIRERYPSVGVLVLSSYAEEEYAHELLSQGATGVGYLLKDRITEIDTLAHAMREVARGGSVLDPKVVEAVVTHRQRSVHSPLGELTQRERQVLDQVALGKNNAAIARDLYLSDRAVEKHISSIFQKLGLVDEPDANRRVMAVLTLIRS